jgi:MSHA biogenesis protein MshP
MTKTVFRSLRRSRGVGIVTAIFLLVVLAGLGVALVTVFTAQQTSTALDEQGARAYQAARAGIEWGLFRQMRNPADPCAGPASPATFALPAGTSLSAFTVTVVCIPITYPGQPELTRRVLRATACNQPGANGCPNPTNSVDYVQRVVEAEI